MATKKSTAKKKSAGLLQKTDTSLFLASVFATLSVVFMVLVYTKYY